MHTFRSILGDFFNEGSATNPNLKFKYLHRSKFIISPAVVQFGGFMSARNRMALKIISEGLQQ